MEKHLGGRKFILSVLGVALIPVLAHMHAAGDAYLALAALVGAYNGANAVQLWSADKTAREARTVKIDIEPE